MTVGVYSVALPPGRPLHNAWFETNTRRDLKVAKTRFTLISMAGLMAALVANIALAQTPPATGAVPNAPLTAPSATAASAPEKPTPEQKELVLVVLGDSLSAGYNLPGNKAFPAVLEDALRAGGHKVKVVNAGVSGDTTTGGLERLDWSVPDNASGVIVELGANDMLRGVDTAIPRDALTRIVTRLQGRNIPVMLAGMRAAPNLGGRYAEDFEGIFKDLSGKHNLVLYPFFLDGVAGERSLLLDDGMHPNPEGVKTMVRNILPTVEKFIATLRKS